MQAEKDKVVSFHYRLSEADGAEIESSRTGEPMVFLFGQGAIIAGLEDAIAGHVVGDKFDVTLSPEQAYGLRREDAVQRVPKKYFPHAEKLKPGMVTVLKTDQGARSVVVAKVGSSVVDVDVNHPLAGKSLHFDVEIVDMRDAAAEEIAHGHVHGSDGHHH